VASPLYIIDTNILVHYVGDDGTWSRLRTDYQLLLIEPIPILSIVTTGELRSLALQWGWGPAELDRMEFILGYLDVVPVEDPTLVDKYAEIDAHFQRRGRKLGKSDPGIAAASVLFDARLLTTDRDFDELDPLFLKRDWIAPV
jgi:tRNA(fMet)-specific endonuclease VapC